MESYLETLFKLKGNSAILVGGGGYLLSEIAKGLSLSGVNVAICDNNLNAAKEVAEKIVFMGGRAIAIEADVCRKEDIEKSIAEVEKQFGGLQYAVIGPNLNAPTPFLDISIEEWNDILRVQLTGTMICLQAFGTYMLKAGSGSIVTMSSASAGPPLSKAFTYSVAKAGVRNLTMNVAREWATQGVRVNALRPGFFPTDWSKKHFIDETRNAAILGHTPMQRYGKPEELVGAVIWLLSDAASFVTGAEIAVDGGFSCMTI